jgi:hypothetical protein
MRHLFYSVLTFVLFAATNISSLSAQQIHSKIQEVYADKTQELVGNDPARLDFLNDLLDNRINIIESELTPTDKYTKLSSVTLLNKYNSSLTRDAVFDPLTFNPLKYNFPLSASKTIIYRVDNTDYLIVIHPQTLKKD